MPLLSVNNLIHKYPGEENISFPDFALNKGQHSLISGPSGVGKTTLLHLIAGLRKIQSGSVIIDGQNLADLNGSGLDKFRAENLGIVFQNALFIEALNVSQNISSSSWFSKTQRQKRSLDMKMIEKLGIENKLRKSVSTLSTGEKQRVSLARAFHNHPKLIIADEPSSALDNNNTEHVIELMFELAEEYNCTFLVVSHDERIYKHFSQHISLNESIKSGI